MMHAACSVLQCPTLEVHQGTRWWMRERTKKGTKVPSGRDGRYRSGGKSKRLEETARPRKAAVISSLFRLSLWCPSLSLSQHCATHLFSLHFLMRSNMLTPEGIGQQQGDNSSQGKADFSTGLYLSFLLSFVLCRQDRRRGEG